MQPPNKPDDVALLKYSHLGGFAEGDHVTRDGTDVQLVKDMSDDGLMATFVCQVAPVNGWCAVGDEEQNLCRRYGRVTQDLHTGQWQPSPDKPVIDVFDVEAAFREAIAPLVQQIIDQFLPTLTDLIQAGFASSTTTRDFSLALGKSALTRTSRPHYRRNPKRRAMRK